MKQDKIIVKVCRIIIPLLAFFPVILRADETDTLKIVAHNPIDYYVYADTIYIFKYTVENNTGESALLWFSEITENAFIRYFFKSHGPYTIPVMTAFYELGSTLTIEDNDIFSELFKSFYKIIDSGCSFEIYFIEDVHTERKDMDSIIHVMSEHDVVLNVTDSIFKIMRQYESYKADYIVIKTSDFPQ